MIQFKTDESQRRHEPHDTSQHMKTLGLSPFRVQHLNKSGFCQLNFALKLFIREKQQDRL